MGRVLKALGMSVLLLLIYFFFQMVFSLTLALGSVIFTGALSVASGSVPDVYEIASKLTELLYEKSASILFVSAGLSFMLYILIYSKRKPDFIGLWQRRRTGPVLLLSLIVFSVSFSLVLDYLLSLLARAEKLHSLFEQYGQVVNLISGENFLLVLLFVGILIPIFEEVLFRGLIFGELKKAMRVSIAVLLQAFLFGLSHMNLIQGIYAFVLGLILGAVYEKSRNLLLPMVVHISFNAFSVLMSGIVSPESLQKWQTVLNMAGFLLFFVSGAVLIWSMRKSEGGNRNECNKGSGSPQLHPGVSEGSD